MAEDDNAPKIVSRKEAAKNGAKRYFTGMACPRGHICERYTSTYQCVKCVVLDGRVWWLQHPDKLREKKRRHAQRSKAIIAIWRNKNKEKIAKARREQYAKDRVRLNARQRSLYARNPEKRKTHNRAYQARKKGNGGTHTAGDVYTLLAMQRYRCAYCRANLKRGYHVDHILALSKGGSNDKRNLQLLCQPCNSRKWAKDQMDVMRAMGKLL